MLLDSNSIIYSVKPEFGHLRKLIAQHNPAVSAISFEVLGYHQLLETDKQDLLAFFNAARIIHISYPVLKEAVTLRQQRKMSLGDSIISATAILNNLTLITANVKDFHWIEHLK